MAETTCDGGIVVTASGRRVAWQLLGPRDGDVVGYLHGQPGSRKDTLIRWLNSARRWDPERNRQLAWARAWAMA